LFAAAAARAAGHFSLAASAGRFGLLRGGSAFEAGGELRCAPRSFRWLPRVAAGISPVAGGMATSDGELYAYAGLRLEVPLGKAWMLSPQSAAGLYHAGDGKDLGGAVEFRSGFELSRRIGARSSLGLLLYHLSNAGLYRRNPGTESLVLTYSLRP